MLDFLLGRGAKIDKPNDTFGFTALYAALDVEKPIELIRFLVEKGANVNKPISTGDTPIASASARGNVIVMQYLIDQGADINCSNQDGDVPIHEAFCSGNFDAIDLLLSLEANPNTQNNDGKTSLHWMLMNKSLDAQKKIDVIKKYSHICDFTLVDKDGKTPMDYAIEYCPEATVYLDTSLPLEANLFAQQEEAAIDITGEIVLEDSTT